MQELKIYTDGACHPNPNGYGGWGVLIYDCVTSKEQCLRGGVLNVTNNQMELQACIEGLKYIKEPAKITILTDSKYVKNGITLWMEGWKKNGWKTKQKKPVKNQTYWQEIDKLNQFHDITWKWVKGHAGIYGNEEADRLATLGREEIKEDNKGVKLDYRAEGRKVVKEWEKVTNKLARLFMKKYFADAQDDFHWVGDIVGGILTINEYFYEVDLVKESIELDAPWELLEGFYQYSMDCFDKGVQKEVNFKNYVRLNGKLPK
jgi:ribonuclease HI